MDAMKEDDDGSARRSEREGDTKLAGQVEAQQDEGSKHEGSIGEMNFDETHMDRECGSVSQSGKGTGQSAASLEAKINGREGVKAASQAVASADRDQGMQEKEAG